MTTSNCKRFNVSSILLVSIYSRIFFIWRKLGYLPAPMLIVASHMQLILFIPVYSSLCNYLKHVSIHWQEKRTGYPSLLCSLKWLGTFESSSSVSHSYYWLPLRASQFPSYSMILRKIEWSKKVLKIIPPLSVCVWRFCWQAISFDNIKQEK